MSSDDLPPFAKQWAQQWKRAAPALQAIRDQELRQLDGDRQRASDFNHLVYDRYPERHGMVIMQRWFMRQALLQQAQKERSSGGRGVGST